jgi:hypothetical protein
MNNCQFIIDYNHVFTGEGEPILCDQLARLRLYENWFCAHHYDIVERGGATSLAHHDVWRYGRVWDERRQAFVDEIRDLTNSNF